MTREMKDRFSWKKITGAKAWRPKEGEELVGYYAGRTLKSGAYGQYEVVLIHVPYEGMRTISGTAIIGLIDASRIEVDHPVKIVFVGKEKLEGEKYWKRFELYVAELPIYERADATVQQ